VAGIGPAHQRAVVGVQRGAGDAARVVRDQPGHQAGDVLGLRHARERHGGERQLARLVDARAQRARHVLEARNRHVRLDPAGQHGVDLHVARRELDRQRTHQAADAGFRGAVARVPADAQAREHRGDRHEVARARTGQQPLLGRAQAVVGPGQVGGHEIAEAVRAAGRVRSADAAVGDQRVERAGVFAGLAERALDLLGLARVAGDGARGPGNFFQARAVAREQRDARTLGHEAQGDRPADAGSAARDRDVQALETACGRRHERIVPSLPGPGEGLAPGRTPNLRIPIKRRPCAVDAEPPQEAGRHT
jgi:hypothetical protein